jgi:hypothetical protein
MTGGQLVTICGGGHAPTMRDPVRVNLLIRDFTESLGLRPRTTAVPRGRTRARDRRKRVLYVSSPIGLGHVRRDLAIAAELRASHPDLLIDWLAQPPVTRVLEERGERVHPASRVLASESSHIESEAGEHDLHVFQALRRMDEILVANCAPSSATGPVSRSAWSRSAARVSGPACCAVRRRRSPPPAASSPGSGWSS